MLQEIKKVFKNSAIYGLGNLIPKLTGIILVPVYTHYMLPADYGLYSLATMICSMLGVVMMLGQNGSLTLFFRTTQTDGSEEETKSLLFSVVTFTTLFASLIFVLLLLLGPALMPWIVKSPQFTFQPYMVVVLLTALVGVPFGLMQAVQIARGWATQYMVLSVISFAINTGFTIYFVVALRQGAYGSLKGTFLGVALLLPAALWLLMRNMRARFSWKWLRKSLVFGLPLVPHYFAGFILTYADRAVIERYRGLTEVGLYSLAYNLSMVLNLASTAINTAWGPVYYDLAATEDGRQKLPRLTTIYAAAVTAAAIAYLLLSRETLLVLASSKYASAAGLIPIVVGGYYFFALYMVLSTGIFFAKKTKWVPVISALAAVVNIGMNLWLVPRYGMWAAAWNTFLAYGVMALIARYLSGKLTPVKFEDGRLLKLVGVFLAAFGLNFVVVALPLSLWIQLLLKLVVLGLAAGAFSWLDIVSVKDVTSVLKRVIASRRRKLTVEESASLVAQSDEVQGMGDEATPRLGGPPEDPDRPE